MHAELTITELEQAINYWRAERPSVGEERALSPEVDMLASIYALMIFNRIKSLSIEKIGAAPMQLIEVWRKNKND
jgi:hypothetical protein